MIQLPLSQIPNQTFSFQSANSFFNVTIKLAGNEMLLSYTQDNVLVLSNARIIINMAMNDFALVSSSDNLPDYNEFDVTQFLVYLND